MSLSEGIRKVIKAPLVSMQYRPFKRARRMSLTKKSLDMSVDEERWVFQWRPTLPNPIPNAPTVENVSQQVETGENFTPPDKSKKTKFEVGEKRQAPAEVGEKSQTPAQGSSAGEANVTVGKDALGGEPKKPGEEKMPIECTTPAPAGQKGPASEKGPKDKVCKTPDAGVQQTQIPATCVSKALLEKEEHKKTDSAVPSSAGAPTTEKPVSEKKDPGSEPKRTLVQELLEYKPPRKFAAKDKDMMTVAPGKKKNNAEEPTRTQGRNHGYRKIRRAVRKFKHLQRAVTNDPPKGAATQ